MSTALLPQILDIGLAAALRADNLGVAAKITQIAIGDLGYTPNQSQTAMYHQVAVFEVAGGEEIGPGHLHITAHLDGDDEFWVREVGFLLEDGTLFAVWSHPTVALAWKGPSTTLLQAFDLLLTAVPPGSVTVEAGNPSLSLIFAGEMASLATAIVNLQRRSLAPLLI